MGKEFEVRWEGELPAGPQDVWEAVTRHADGWLWKIEYEPWVGGAERGLTTGGGTVTAWDPPRHFATRTRPEAERDGPNELDYRLEPSGAGTHLRYVHRGVFGEDDDDDRELDQCRQHTAFYNHSLGEYARHFSGREPVYVAADGPQASTQGGFAAVRRALGLAGDVAAGDRVRLTPAGLEPIDGVVDYATHAFLGVRSADALYRVYGRDAWGYPVGVAHHLFAAGADRAAGEQAWSDWLRSVFATAGVA
ncbi:MAG TPA: SRPBCC domain-containing protein [Baekduia sp.]|uniref:SRPBCC family protein n=1 Tax=Baekduia sp. TaxID=2600305 RepID=UPI002C90E85D|nr:SRPBCC domain-containing protein [Baekduia sp.]HMJ36708.1 SRPBCC domain-containing protein [Baekduia sp.]